MAQLVVAAAGAALGGFIAPGIVAFGMTGASLGWMAGSMLGSAFAPTQKSSGPQLSDLSVSTSAYGTPIPYIAGSPRVAGQIVWASTKREIATTTEQGKGGGGSEYTSFTYEVDLLILLTDNEISGVARIWSNGELVFDGGNANAPWTRFTPYTGAASQLPDPTYEAAVGTANAPAYRGRGSVFIESLQLGGSGQIPNLTFEIGSSSYNYASPFTTTSRTRSVNHAIYVTSAMHSSLDDGSVVIYAGQPAIYIAGTITSYRRYIDGTESVLGSVAWGAANAPFNGVYIAGWSDTPVLGTTNTGILRLHDAGCAFIKDIALPGLTLTNVTHRYFKRGGYEYILAESEASVIYRVSGTTATAEFSSTARGSVHTMFPGADVNYTLSHTKQLTAYSKSWLELWNVDMSAFSLLTTVETPTTAGDAVLFEEEPGRVIMSLSDSFFLITQSGAALIGTTSKPTANLDRLGGNWYFRGVWYELNTQSSPGVVWETPLNRTAVSAVSPAALSAVVANLCTISGLSEAQYSTTALSTITRPVRSMAISSVSSARTVLDMLAASYHFEAVLSDKIYFRPRASAPAATLTFNELGVIVDSGTSPEPLPLTQANELEIPAQMALTYSNVDGDYQTDTQYSDRLLTGQESTSAMQVPLGFTSSEAKQIVDAMLLDKAVSALTTSVSMGLTRAALEPTDVVILQTDFDVIVPGTPEVPEVPGIPGDSSYSSVSLLLHGNGTNGSTTFTDNSPTPKTVTAVGNAQISTAQSKFGGASMYFDGTGDYLTVPRLLAGTAFTAECWFRISAIGVQQTLFGQYSVAGLAGRCGATVSATGFPTFFVNGLTGGDLTLTHASAITANTWNHLAVVRDGSGNFTLYVNGVGGAAALRTGDLENDLFNIGRLGNNSLYFTGYIDDLRVTTVARYTANFTPPTAAFADSAPTAGTPAIPATPDTLTQSSYRMRIVKKAEASGVTTLECVQDDSTVFTQTGTTAGGTASQTTVLSTPTTTLELLDVPLLRDVDNAPGHYVAVKGSAANWASAGLYESQDNLTFTLNTTISSQAVIGTCSTTLGAWADGNVFDEVSSVTVNVGTQQLSSVTRDDILASQSLNAALIGSEVVQYRTATLVSAGVYALRGFLRGQRGTASTGHSASDRFIVLASGGLRFIPLQQGDLGRLRYYKAASAGQKLSAVTSQSLTPAGITLKPFAPVDARANRDTADTVLTWIRQTRLSTRIVGTLGISSPLGEAAESYEVEIYSAGHAALLRTLTSSTPAVTYTSAQQVTDFGSAPASLAVKIYQISATVGRGTPLITTV